MLDELLKLIKEEHGIGHLANILQEVERLAMYVNEGYLKDGNMKNAAIDAICIILQNQKDK